MVVEFQKLHSNYLQSRNSGLKSEGRINKLYPIGNSETNCVNMTDMCVVNNNLKKTILTNSSNGLLSFKGRSLSKADIDKVYTTVGKYLEGVNDKDVAALRKLAEQLTKEHPYMTKIFGNETFQKAMLLMNNNQLLADAGIALLYTCCMRPLSIAALPTKDKNEKEKNTYQIGHSISTGIIGFITAFAIQTPMAHAIDKVMKAAANNNAQKYIDKSAEQLFRKENIEKIKMLMERTHQPITLPLKAALTIFLVPRILKVFGLTKKPKNVNVEKPQEQQIPYDAFQYFAAFKRKNSSFQNFSGGLMHDDK